MEDGWNTNPFELVEDEKNRLIGRGATDDKGPVLGWINVVEAHKALGIELPVNIKFCLEGMEESGSEGLDPLIFDEASKYFKDVDAVCISDSAYMAIYCHRKAGRSNQRRSGSCERTIFFQKPWPFLKHRGAWSYRKPLYQILTG